MKAGIYRSPNGNLIYVAKDRTVKATNLAPSTWPGMKVSHRAKDDTVTLCGYTFTRFADVPNGCTDHGKALAEASAANKAEIEAILGPVGDVDLATRIEAIKRTEDPVSAKGARPGYEYTHVVNENPVGEEGNPNMIFAPFIREVDQADKQALLYKAAGYRVCHARAARKHRKRGDSVVGIGYGRFAWRPVPDAAASLGRLRKVHG